MPNSDPNQPDEPRELPEPVTIGALMIDFAERKGIVDDMLRQMAPTERRFENPATRN